MIKFDEFKKVDLRVGIVSSLKNYRAVVNYGDGEFQARMFNNVKVNDQVIVVLDEGSGSVLFCGDNILVPEKEMKAGDKIS